MIEIINNRIILIDDKANMVEIDDEALLKLYHSIETVVGDIKFNERRLRYEPVEDIYYHIVEKIYQMPDYCKWNDVPFKEKPKAKLLIAFNRFFFDKVYENINRHTK